MNKEYVQAVLRIVAVITMLIGVTLTTTTAISVIGAKRVVQNAPHGLNVRMTGVVGEAGNFAIFAHATIIGWGIAFFVSSSILARIIAGRDELGEREELED
jgi:hypothetical protein